MIGSGRGNPRFLPFESRRCLPAILIVSLLLRIALALQGGQYFFPDESRWGRGALVYFGVLEHNWRQVALGLGSPEHAGFTWIAVALTPVQHALAWLMGLGNWSAIDNYYASSAEAAVLLGLASTLNVWLIHRLCRAAGGSLVEANSAALLAAAAASLFHFSRHLIPYDWGLAAGLTALIFSVTGRTARRQFMAGACTAACYEIYNAYWFFVPMTFATLIIANTGGWRTRAGALLRWGVGGVLGAMPFLLPGVLVEGTNYWVWMTKFAGQAPEGYPPEGWSLPWEYLWHAEGWLGIAAIVFIAIQLSIDAKSRALPRRAGLWLVLFALLYGLLTFESTGLGKIAIFARTIRPLVPLFCLLGGYSLARFLAMRAGWQFPVLAAIAAGAIVNFLPHYALTFPTDIQRKVWNEFGIPRQGCAFKGTARFAAVPPPPARPRPDLLLMNVETLFPLESFVGYPPGEVIFSVAHPSSFKPYQYQGHSPRERALLEQHDCAIKLIRLNGPGKALSPNPALESAERRKAAGH